MATSDFDPWSGTGLVDRAGAIPAGGADLSPAFAAFTLHSTASLVIHDNGSACGVPGLRLGGTKRY